MFPLGNQSLLFIGDAAFTIWSQSTVTSLGLLTVVILIVFSAIFASAEIAIFSLSDHRIHALVDEQSPGASTLARLKTNPRRLLVTILVGNNIANIGMSAITTGLLGLYFTPGESVLIATFGVTSIVLLFGETVPKSYGVEHSEQWSLRIARPLRLIQLGLYPLVEIFDRCTRAVNGLMGSQGGFETAYVSRAEVREVITAGQRAGIFTDAEHQMLQRLLRFRNRIVKETMVPRRDVVGVEADAALETAIDICIDRGFRELPVYEDVLDTVVGVVHLREVVDATNRGSASSLRAIARAPHVVPESKEVDELLTELRENRRRMAIVVDEFGATAGIVTIEDIVEEIIGEVLGEHEAPPIRWLDDTTAIIRGELNVHVANEVLGLELPETEDYETVAGLLMAKTGRIIEEGESVAYADVRLTVETTENNRILEIRVNVPDQPPGTEPPNGD